mmetsp:Transcript_43428/g.102288  ORF Transcript_43428/g.102288 Transcript_43428/m.102288 type:complete len:285 (+) Transcript_43428:82-936(+)
MARGRVIVALAFAGVAAALTASLFDVVNTFAVPRAARVQHVPDGRASHGRSARSKLNSPVVRHDAGKVWPAHYVNPFEGEKLKVGGDKTKALFTALVAAFAAFSLHTADVISKATLGLPLWAGPSAGVCVMFSVAAVGAADAGTLTDFPAVFKFAVEVAIAVTGSCAFAVWASSQFSSLAVRRALSVGVCAAWMLFNPGSAVFPPSAGYCALYIDQLLAGGPLGKLSYTFGVFPCALGVMVVLLSSRLAAFVGAGPLRLVWNAKMRRERHRAAMKRIPARVFAR